MIESDRTKDDKDVEDKMREIRCCGGHDETEDRRRHIGSKVKIKLIYIVPNPK